MEKLNASTAGKRLVGVVMYVFNQTEMKKEKQSLKKVMLFPHLIWGKLNVILPHYRLSPAATATSGLGRKFGETEVVQVWGTGEWTGQTHKPGRLSSAFVFSANYCNVIFDPSEFWVFFFGLVLFFNL